MSMSYCRFQNTVGDMHECLDYLQESGYHNLSDDELKAAIQMNEIALDMAEELAGIGE